MNILFFLGDKCNPADWEKYTCSRAHVLCQQCSCPVAGCDTWARVSARCRTSAAVLSPRWMFDAPTSLLHESARTCARRAHSSRCCACSTAGTRSSQAGWSSVLKLPFMAREASRDKLLRQLWSRTAAETPLELCGSDFWTSGEV